MFLPARVYAPALVRAGKPLPLLIALHGAGGDEAIFMKGYGAGEITRLADKLGFIVVSPSTYWVMPNPSALEGILAAIAADYSIDRDRVYVLGHSLGAMAAAGMAQRDHDMLAGAVLIAGGSVQPERPICPTLVIAAEHDPLMLPDSLRKGAQSARDAGRDVEFRLIGGAGHVLVCDESLGEAVEWLLKHHLPRK
jgi:poly(3-hydroxybutyrate) depolymerase